MDTKILARFFIREILGVVIIGVALFWSAGEINWLPAWALILLNLAWITATAFVILRHNPDLLAERLGPRKNAKRWDTALMGLRGILMLAVLVVAGLDHRYGWSTEISTGLQVAALLVTVLGYVLVVWATATNAFFSQIVRIQTERGHTVVSGGPYHFVRHPAYAGNILSAVSTPILLGSWWALLLGAIDALLIFLRTALEDRTLQADLPGYPEYTRNVRHRLVPGVW